MSNVDYSNDFELEFKDAVKDPTNPEMQQIAEQIPEKYKGKSVDDLVSMHVNLEKVMRRQGNEVGQLRKLVDSQSQLLSTTRVAGIVPGHSCRTGKGNRGSATQPTRRDAANGSIV
jgi:hypothetical protein